MHISREQREEFIVAAYRRGYASLPKLTELPEAIMRRSFASGILLCAVLIFASGNVGGKNDEKSQPRESVGAQQLALGAWRGSQLMGITVYDRNGSRVGAIADIVGDVKGQVVYLVLSHGGILGIGDKLIPLPWELIEPGEKAGTLRVQLSKDALEQAPNFNSDKWPDFTRPDWKAKTKTYYDAFRTKKENKLK